MLKHFLFFAFDPICICEIKGSVAKTSESRVRFFRSNLNNVIAVCLVLGVVASFSFLVPDAQAFAAIQESSDNEQKLNEPLPYLDEEARAAAAQEFIDRPIRLKRLGPSGTTRFVSGNWSGIGIEISNFSDSDRIIESATYAQTGADRVFSRKLWVPAKSTVTSAYPFWVPASREFESGNGGEKIRRDSRLDLKSWLLADQEDGEFETISRSTGELQFSDWVPLEHGHRRTGMLSDPPGPEESMDEAYELLVAYVVEAGRSRLTYQFQPNLMPASPFLLDTYENILVSSDRFRNDSVGLKSLRQWLNSGGNLWVMLDRIEDSTFEQVLSGTHGVEIVDRTELNNVRLKLPGDGVYVPDDIEERYFEQPVELVRVIVDPSQVAIWVNGWPALFWVEVGEGRAMVTTLGARGWLRPRPSYLRSGDVEVHTDHMVVQMLRRTTTDFFGDQNSSGKMLPDLGHYASEQVGYEVIPRRLIISSLIMYLLVMGLVGIVSYRSGRARRLVWLSPVIALLFAVGLGGWGYLNRSYVPPTLVHAQFVQLQPRSREVIVNGTAALYLPTQSDVVMQGAGATLVELTPTNGQTQRIEFDDMDHWQRNERVGPGTTQWDYVSFVNLPKPVFATGHFDGDKLIGEMHSDSLEDISDLVLVTENGMLPGHVTRKTPDAIEFEIESINPMSKGQYLDTAVMDREQQRRHAVYHEIFSRPGSLAQFKRPTLLFWGRGLDSQLEFPHVDRSVRQALYSLPIKLEPTKPDTEVWLSSPWLPFEPISQNGGQSAIFNKRSATWVDAQKASDVFIVFQLPLSTLPFDLQGGQVELQLQAPDREVEVFIANGELKKRLYQGDGFTGRMSFSLNDIDEGMINADGELRLGLSIGESTSKRSQNPWRIIDIDWRLKGRVSEP